MNISPKGFYEGFLLKSGKNVVQVNLPKEHLHSFADGWAPGSEISVEVEAEEPWGSPAHKVFRLVRVVDNGGRKADKDHHPPRDFSGRIERLSYALHGEVNGGILESGRFPSSQARGRAGCRSGGGHGRRGARHNEAHAGRAFCHRGPMKSTEPSSGTAKAKKKHGN